jgi:protein involved in polysaccharide export with SLBB domain
MITMKALWNDWGGRLALGGLACLGLWLCGCQTTQRPAMLTGTPIPNGATPVVLRVGELLTVTFSDLVIPVVPFEGRIKEDGTITLILNQTFVAAGKSIVDLEKEIRERYVPKLFVNLTATVRVHDRFFYVDGQVKQPSRQEYRSDITVLGAIAAAGGGTDFANLKKVQIIRADNQKITVDCKKAKDNPELDLPIYPNDRVMVPRRSF